MKGIVIIGLIFFCISCKPSILVAQEKESENLPNKKPRFSEKDIYQISPNSIHIIGQVESIRDKSIDLCENIYNHTALINVVEIIGSGSGIINMLNKDERVQMIFMMGYSEVINNKKMVFEGIKEGELFKGIIIEKLCKDSGKTHYIISQYKKQ